MKENLEDFIWYETYRPNDINNLALSKKNRKVLDKILERKKTPHLLLYGPAGSGKTTIALIITRALANGKMILNASSEDRGIATIRTKVKQFASAKTRKNKQNIVFFDEADGLTPEAQTALKNDIEKYHKNCRFIFTCNNIDGIIEPIQSRCIQLRFETPPEKLIIKHCIKILKKEKIEYKKKHVKEIVGRYYPDVRSVINNLESCSLSGELNTKDFLDRFDPLKLVKYIQTGKIFAARNVWSDTSDFTRLYRALAEIIGGQEKCGFGLDNENRVEALIIIADYLYKDRTIADREMNFTACVVEIMNLLEVKINFKATS